MSMIAEAMRALEAAVQEAGVYPVCLELGHDGSMITVGPWTGHGETVTKAVAQLAANAQVAADNGAKVIAAVSS